MNKVDLKPGRSIDVGTGFIVSSQLTSSDDIVTKSIRDAFLEIVPTNKMVHSTVKKSLLKAQINFIEKDNKIIILGNDALTQSVERQSTLKRPMSKGVISTADQNSFPIFKALVSTILGSPMEENEKVTFTVPATPIDANFDIVYHTSVISSILQDLGYTPIDINEAYALSFSTLADHDFTGISVSFGAGMVNVAMTNMADLVGSFAIAKGGDFIDEATASSLGFNPNMQYNEVTPNLVTAVKESGIDILNPDSSDRIQVALSAHYRQFIKIVCNEIKNHFLKKKDLPKFLKPIPVSISGGTTLAGSFKKVFEAELKSIEAELPFKIKVVLHDKDAALSQVAEGALIALSNF